MEAQWRCRIKGMTEKVSGEDSSGRAWCQRCRTTDMDTEAEDMWDSSR